MTMLVTMLLVGVGSYLFRVVPLLLVDRVRMSARTEELMGYAVLAAMAGLLANVLVEVARDPVPSVPAVAPWIGLAAGAAAALARQSLGRVALCGMTAYLAALALSTVAA
jgi:branched-subunit amino acid transport protein